MSLNIISNYSVINLQSCRLQSAKLHSHRTVNVDCGIFTAASGSFISHERKMWARSEILKPKRGSLSIMASTTQTFTATQVLRYFNRVCFDVPKSSAILPAPTLETLRRLIACHLQVIPFENLSLHYSTHRNIILEKEFLFEKIVKILQLCRVSE